MARYKSKQAEEDFEHPSQDHSARFPEDQLLRDHRFAIRDRPAQGEPLWQRGGVVFSQREALWRCRQLKGGLAR